MRTLDNRINEIEKVLSTDTAKGLPCLVYVSNATDDEQTVEQAKLRAFEAYKADNIKDYPQLETMGLSDFEKSKNVTVHIKITNFEKEATV